MAQHKLDPAQETVRISVRVPVSVRDVMVKSGGKGRAALSRGLRRLIAERTVREGDEDAVVLHANRYAAMCAEIERLRKATRR